MNILLRKNLMFKFPKIIMYISCLSLAVMYVYIVIIIYIYILQIRTASIIFASVTVYDFFNNLYSEFYGLYYMSI